MNRMKYFRAGCFFAIATMLSLPAAGNIHERDELFYAATGTNGEKRAGLLIRAAEASPENAVPPLEMLLKTRLSRRELAECIRKYDRLWQKYPDHPDIVWYGLILNEKFSIWNKNTLENLKKSKCGYSRSGADNILIPEIKKHRLSLHSLFGDNVCGIKFADTLSYDKYFLELASFYHVTAFRARVAGEDKKADMLFKKYLQAIPFTLKNLPKEMKIRDLTALMIRLFKRGEKEHATALFEHTKKLTDNQNILDNLRSIFCLQTSDFQAAKQETALIKSPEINKDVLLFTSAINARKLDEAKALLSKIPSGARGTAELNLAAASGDAKAIANAGNNPALDPKVRALYKFHAAGILKDKKLYFEAKKLLGNQPLSVDELNTVGYVAAELGVELDESEVMLRRAVNATPYYSAHLDSLAYVCYLKRRYAEADKLITKALNCITPEVPPSVLLEHAGDIALAQGNFLRAKKMYLRAIDMGKDDISFDMQKTKRKLERIK